MRLGKVHLRSWWHLLLHLLLHARSSGSVVPPLLAHAVIEHRVGALAAHHGHGLLLASWELARLWLPVELRIDGARHLEAVVGQCGARLRVLVEELGTLHELHGGLVVLLFEELDDLLFQRVDLELVDEDLLVLILDGLFELCDAGPVLEVLFLLLEEVGAWSVRLLLGATVRAGGQVSSIQPGKLQPLRLKPVHLCGLSLLLLELLGELLLLLKQILVVSLELLVLELGVIELDDQHGVLLRLLDDLVLVSLLSLDRVDFQRCDISLLLSQPSVQLLDLLYILLFACLRVRGLAHHVVLIELHQTTLVGLVVAGLHNFVDILGEFEDNLVLLLRRLLLLDEVHLQLRYLRLVLRQLLALLVHLLDPLLELALQLEQLLLLCLNLRLFWLQGRLHLSSPVRQHVL